MCEDTAVGDTLLGHDLLPTSATTLMRALVSGRTIRFVASSESHKIQRQPSPSPSPPPPPPPPRRVTNPLLAFVGDTEIVVVP
ncbi:hypothetical protein M0804_003501 [Polistes exclamans]|nr:hypothetical protein M0804_003501 [Polistes exclamans]